MTGRSTCLLVMLLLAAASAGAQGIGDHLKCHTTSDPLKLAAAADLAATLQPQYSDSGCIIGKPKLFCTPTTMTDVTPTSPLPPVVGTTIDNDFICYRLRCPNRPPAQEIADRFGVRTQTRYRSSMLCVPARSTAVTTTTSTPTTTTPTTTTPVRPICAASIALDPDDEVTTLVRGQPTTLRVRVTSTGGGIFWLDVYDSELRSSAACPADDCAPTFLQQCGDRDYVFVYTTPMDAPASLDLRAFATPDGPLGCAIGSPHSFDTKILPVVDP